MTKPNPTNDPAFKRVLGNLLSAPPKPHSEMKIGKRKRKETFSKTETKPSKAKKSGT